VWKTYKFAEDLMGSRCVLGVL